jgi:hypothetical protein
MGEKQIILWIACSQYKLTEIVSMRGRMIKAASNSSKGSGIKSQRAVE